MVHFIFKVDNTFGKREIWGMCQLRRFIYYVTVGDVFCKVVFVVLKLRFCHLYSLSDISSINIALFYLMDKD